MRGRCKPPAARDIVSGLTLFQIEESIALLPEAAKDEGMTPEIEQALATYLQGALEKRDRVAEFIQYCEWMADTAKAESSGCKVSRNTSRGPRIA